MSRPTPPDVRDDPIFHEVVTRDCYRFRRAIELSTKRPFVVVDLGAHVGHFSRMAVDAGAWVLAVEMDEACWGRLNPEAALHVEQAAVIGDRPPTGYRRKGGVEAGFLVYEPTDDCLPLRATRTLADLLTAHGLTRVDFLKLDIEGAEWDVLGRAERDGVLARVQRIGMEWHHPVDPAFAGHGFSPHVADLVRLLYDFHVEMTPTRFAGGYLWAWRA